MGAGAGAAPGATRSQAQPVGVYRPRRPRASPLYRLLDEHFQSFATVYDERFAPRWGPWRRVVAEVVEKFLACGILTQGFARVRCGGCRHEYLLAFSCKCRYFCPSCHAKRLAGWSLWLEEILLAPVPHRQVVVLTVPKRLRPYFLYNRGLLGDVSRVAARMLTACIRATTGEQQLAVGIVAPFLTHGSLANWHPHLHLLVTDGGFQARRHLRAPAAAQRGDPHRSVPPRGAAAVRAPGAAGAGGGPGDARLAALGVSRA